MGAEVSVDSAVVVEKRAEEEKAELPPRRRVSGAMVN